MKIIVCACLFIFCLSIGITPAEENHAKILKKVSPSILLYGKYRISARFIDAKVSPKKPYRVIHLFIAPTAENKPVIHPLYNVYQEDRRYSKLFSEDGSSAICGPTCLANVLMYLKHRHDPRYDNLFEARKHTVNTIADAVFALYSLCQTNTRDTGTYPEDIRDAAKNVVKDAGYGAKKIFWQGAYGDVNEPVSLSLLRECSQVREGEDKAVVLLFGWYTRGTDTDGSRIYVREGGHYVALAGYDENNRSVFYVSNPLIDYTGRKNTFSKITLKSLPVGWRPPDPTMIYYTEDLVGGHFAILESVVVILPEQSPYFVGHQNKPIEPLSAIASPHVAEEIKEAVESGKAR